MSLFTASGCGLALGLLDVWVGDRIVMAGAAVTIHSPVAVRRIFAQRTSVWSGYS